MSEQLWIDKAWMDTEQKIMRTSKRIGATTPQISRNGRYDDDPNSFWTKGFWPGLLWLIYAENKSEQLRQITTAIENKLDDVLHGFYTLHHDVGFVWSLTAVAQYKLLQNEDSKRRALIAASHLAGRFNLKGRFIRAWNGKQANGCDNCGWAIIDCMMNLPILYWASETTGDPRFRHIAIAHADTAVQNHIRPDGSVYHIICYDPETGERIGAQAGQGYAEESAWSRGAAWAIHGMALSYRYTKDVRYLNAAKQAAHFFLAHLPEDYVPYWDMRAPITEQTPRDTTAAACAASGLLEIALFSSVEDAVIYRNWADKILHSLYENYGAWDSDEEALLVKGTVNCPAGVGVEVPIIYGDFFFTEALLKLKGKQEIFW